MKSVIAIRTHRWGEEEERMLARLSGSFPGDIVVVFHNRQRGVRPPIDVVDIANAWVVINELRCLPDWAWRCGDYFYYALRAAKPDYDFYWMVEPDVHFTEDPSDFFARFDKVAADALGSGLKRYTDDIPFTRAFPEVPHYKAVFPLTRFSARALDLLFALRQKYSESPAGRRFFTNDEIFCFSNIMAHEAYVAEALETYAADWLDQGLFATNPTHLLESLVEGAPMRQVCHPVRSREAFVRVVATRLASNTGFLRNMRASLQHLSEEDIDQIVEQSSDAIRSSLSEYRAVGEPVARVRKK
ncbi:MAG: component of SufBCD complex [Paracoccaceae bacterium]